MLKRCWSLYKQGSMMQAELNERYQNASLVSKIKFDEWRNSPQTPSFAPLLNPLAQTPMGAPFALAPSAQNSAAFSAFSAPPPSYSASSAAYAPQPPSFSPAPAPLSSSSHSRSAPVVVPRANCPQCKTGLEFQPPSHQREFDVRCPICRTVARFQVCFKRFTRFLFQSFVIQRFAGLVLL